MKTVLCYGDSNTYGYIPITGLRYPAAKYIQSSTQDSLHLAPEAHARLAEELALVVKNNFRINGGN